MCQNAGHLLGKLLWGPFAPRNKGRCRQTLRQSFLLLVDFPVLAFRGRKAPVHFLGYSLPLIVEGSKQGEIWLREFLLLCEPSPCGFETGVIFSYFHGNFCYFSILEIAGSKPGKMLSIFREIFLSQSNS